MKRRVLLQGIAICAVVWLVAIGAQRLFGGMKASAAKLEAEVREANFADWEGEEEVPDAAEGRRREEQLRKVAVILNGLDFREREKLRDSGVDRGFFRRLAKPEQVLFFELTYEEAIKRMMEALDGLSPEDRKKFVEKGLKELEEGLAQEDMARMKELGDDLLERAAKEGFQEFMQTASAETKMDLAPLMEAMNEAMQGLRGQEWE
ncbi:MAG: hypothetical protein O3A87_12665 [Verrucomicrobia bacterium]|nr:hypothetical protein [Verrucomicrobiota bacterium]MDA1007315.1 hypothetical protein [Verrucomicrobiota bacterium]